MSNSERSDLIVSTLSDAFCDLVTADPAAFRRRFRKMAADPFAFFRGAAPLFYADVVPSDEFDAFLDDRTRRVWIQGDLHAENFGTYMDASGRLVFDVNDFDEAYLGAYTWDLTRFCSSLALLGWAKALPDDVIAGLVSSYVRSYLDHVRFFATSDRDHRWALTLEDSRGGVRSALQSAQLSTRVDLLDSVSVVEDYSRRFRTHPTVRPLEDAERERVQEAYARYLDTVPESKRLGSVSYTLKDAVGKSGFGIGSAGLSAYSLLVEGHTEALENDVVLTMKQGNVAAVSRFVPDDAVADFFDHPGHRTAVSQRSLQAHASPWLGWTDMDGVGYVVSEYSPYESDLDWSSVSEPDELGEVVTQLGQATAKVHCVSDVDLEETPLVEFQVEDALLEVLTGQEDAFVDAVVSFATRYASSARTDHALFVDAFRSGAFDGVAPAV